MGIDGEIVLRMWGCRGIRARGVEVYGAQGLGSLWRSRAYGMWGIRCGGFRECGV